MAKIKTLHDAFVHQLKDIYYAENQLSKALPKAAAKASDPQLRMALEQHQQETERQIQMLEQVFRSIGERAEGVRCKGIEGIISEAEEHMGEAEQPALDAIIVAAAQAQEHYEITRYGTLIAWAQEMGHGEAERIFGQILEQEKAADQKLSRIAEAQVNQRADQMGKSGVAAQ